MYALSVKTQKELAFLKYNKMSGGRRKERRLSFHDEGQPFLIYKCKGICFIKEHLLLSKQR